MDGGRPGRYSPDMFPLKALLPLAGAALGATAALGVTPVSASAGSGAALVPVASVRPGNFTGHKVLFPTQRAWQRGVGNDGQLRRAAGRASSNLMSFQGGVDGIGVTTGPPKVYLVFWGSQWGSVVPSSDGYVHLSGDPAGMAPRLQQLMAGLGTNNELWSGVMTQYCEGIAVGSTSCPSSAAHVGYPTGGALAGVWVDNATPAPSQALDHQIAVEAVTAAGHFANTTPAANRSAQYVIVSPTGTHPGGFGPSGNFCAWHDWNGDTSLVGGPAASSVGDVAFTNLPYLTDLGASCGANFVNGGTAGTLDGVTIVEGHEYAETITDQNPAGGWIDAAGWETGDKCAWLTGGVGGAQNVAFATGSFAMQATWSNLDNSCQIAHSIITNGVPANTVTVTSPGAQTAKVGQAVSLLIHASDSASGQTLSYSASGLPAGLSINSSSGLISGTTTAAASTTVRVVATDGTGASGSASFSFLVANVCVATQAVANPGFETGTPAPWSVSAARILNNSSVTGKEPPHSGAWDALLGGLGTAHTDTLSQSITIPTGCSTYTLSFWLHIDTAETSTRAHDTLRVRLGSTTLASYSNTNHASGYSLKSFNISAFAGQTVTLSFTATENASLQTSFVIDDVAANAS